MCDRSTLWPVDRGRFWFEWGFWYPLYVLALGSTVLSRAEHHGFISSRECQKKKPLLPGDGSNSCLISMTPKVVLGRTTGLLELFALSNFMVSSHLSVRRNLGGLGNLLKEHLEVSGNPEFKYIRKGRKPNTREHRFFRSTSATFWPAWGSVFWQAEHGAESKLPDRTGHWGLCCDLMT